MEAHMIVAGTVQDPHPPNLQDMATLAIGTSVELPGGALINVMAPAQDPRPPIPHLRFMVLLMVLPVALLDTMVVLIMLMVGPFSATVVVTQALQISPRQRLQNDPLLLVRTVLPAP
ncbi:hypothetical protein EXS57_03355 [Candidatus Kaiserbacteria bacterium]|nr:hypothetical protein [Candidatus Kaiserbacteria bacterium]